MILKVSWKYIRQLFISDTDFCKLQAEVFSPHFKWIHLHHIQCIFVIFISILENYEELWMRAKGSLQKFFFKNVTNVTWGGLLGQNVTFLKLSFKSISSHSELILLIFFLEGFPKVIVTTVFVYGAANVVKFRPRMNRKVGVKLCAILTTLIWNIVFLVSSFTL